MYDSHDGGWGPGAWIAMGLMMVAFSGLVAFLVVDVVRNLGHRVPDSGTPTPDQAPRILDERSARGEIDGDEYNQGCYLIRG
jgi:putative membrane protein